MRVENAILGSRAYARGATSPILNLQHGAQLGFSPELGEFVSNAAYVRRNMIAILMQAPRIFKYMPDSAIWYATLKALIETHSQTIDGLNGGLEVETITNPVGGGGMVQHEFTNVTRQNSNPTHTYIEKYNMSIARFWTEYITMFMMDPDSRVPGIATMPNAAEVKDLLPDMYTFSVLYLEPDPLHKSVVKSWLVSNMFPHMSGDIVGRRDITAAMEGQTLNISFGGIAQYGRGVNALAQEVLNSIDITHASPVNRNAHVREIAADILAASSGYRKQAEGVGRDSIRL